MHTTHSRKKVVTTVVAAIAGLAALTSCQFSFSSSGPDYELLESAITDELNVDAGDFGRRRGPTSWTEAPAGNESLDCASKCVAGEPLCGSKPGIRSTWL